MMPMIAEERHVNIAAKMYECRDASKRLNGDQYHSHMAELAKVVRYVEKRDGCSNIVAGVTIAKETRAEGFALLNIMAAVVEMEDPSQ